MLYVLVGLLALAGAVYFTLAAPIADAWMNTTTTAPPYEVTARAQSLHDTLMVADLHNDLLLWPRDPLTRSTRGHSDIPRLREGGVGLQVFAAVTEVPWGRSYEDTPDGPDLVPFLVAAQRWPLRTWTSRLERARYQAQKLRRTVDRDDQLMLLRRASDLDALRERRSDDPSVMGTLLAVEGLHALEGDVENVDVLVDEGYRMMSLTHLHDNALGGSSTGRRKGGLSDFGAAVLDRLAARPVLLDLAHASTALMDEVLAHTDASVLVSHTGVQATCDTPRNLTDRHIEAVADRGGVIGVGLWERAVCGAGPLATARAMRHVADRVGVDHVALGSDFEGTVSVPFDAAGLPLVTEALLRCHFAPDEIHKIMGANVVRVLRRTLPPRPGAD